MRLGTRALSQGNWVFECAHRELAVNKNSNLKAAFKTSYLRALSELAEENAWKILVIEEKHRGEIVSGFPLRQNRVTLETMKGKPYPTARKSRLQRRTLPARSCNTM